MLSESGPKGVRHLPLEITAAEAVFSTQPTLSVLHPGEHPGALRWGSLVTPNYRAEKSTVYQGQAGGLEETALAQLQLVVAMWK